MVISTAVMKVSRNFTSHYLNFIYSLSLSLSLSLILSISSGNIGAPPLYPFNVTRGGGCISTGDGKNDNPLFPDRVKNGANMVKGRLK